VSKANVSSLTIDKLLNDPSSKILFTDTSSGYVSQLRDLGTDTIVNGYYEFYPNGRLKTYEFFYDRKEDNSEAFIKQYGDLIISCSAYRACIWKLYLLGISFYIHYYILDLWKKVD